MKSQCLTCIYIFIKLIVYNPKTKCESAVSANVPIDNCVWKMHQILKCFNGMGAQILDCISADSGLESRPYLSAWL